MQLISHHSHRLAILYTMGLAATIVVVVCAPTDAPESSELEKSSANTQEMSAPNAALVAIAHGGDSSGTSGPLHQAHLNHALVGPTSKQQAKRELDYDYFYKFRNVVGEGVKKALDECRQKFKWDRWNCPLKSFQSIMNQEEFPSGLMPSNKELGLTRALISSGIILSIVRSCSVGSNSLCSCGAPIKMSLQNADLFLENGGGLRQQQQAGSMSAPPVAATSPDLMDTLPDQSGAQSFGSTNQVRTNLATNTAAALPLNEPNHQHQHEPASLLAEATAPTSHESLMITTANRDTDEHFAIDQDLTTTIQSNQNSIFGNRNNRFAWAGCDEVIKLGFKVAKAYLTPIDKTPGNDASHLIDAHNYEAGRQAVKLTMKRQCKCHGTSGACQLKTCWTVPPDMSEVGDYLKRQYRVSAKVGAVTAKETDSASLAKELTAIRPDKLVFADASPDYCYENKQLGINGTLGRYCSRKRHRPDGSEVSRCERDSCDRLCTKCGYKIKREKINVDRQCDCRFVYCCSIECKRCPYVEEIYKCVRHS